MTRLLACMAAAAVTVLGAVAVFAFLLGALGSLSGDPALWGLFMVLIEVVILGTAMAIGFAAFVALACWLLLSLRSPVPRVRSYWTRRLAPTSTAAGRDPQVTLASRCGSTSPAHPKDQS